MSDTTNPSQGLPPEASVQSLPAQEQGAPQGQEQQTQQEATQQEPAKVTLGDDKPEPVVPDSSTDTEFTYDSTGDAGLDYALNFVGKHGYGDTHPAIIAAQQGDFSLIKAELATKGIAGSEAVLALAEQAYARFNQEAQKRDAELAGFAAQAAGGEGNWATVRAWAAANATPQEKAQINSALAQGGIVAQGVIQQLVGMYQSKHTLPKDAASVAAPGATAQSGAPAEPMTAQRYAQAVQELRHKLGGRFTDDHPEYAALQSQRLAARRAGY